MTTKQIEAKKTAVQTKFDAALAIRKILNDTEKAMGKEWDDCTESDILEMVGGEDE